MMKKSFLILMMLALLSAFMALPVSADTLDVKHSGQWNFVGGMFSMYPGGDSNVEEAGATGFWTDISPGITTIVYGGIRHQFQGGDTETYDIEGGAYLAFPFRWKWLPMIGSSVLGHDKTRDDLKRIEYISIDAGLAYFFNGFTKSGPKIPILGIFGLDVGIEIDGVAAFVRYAPGQNRVTAGVGVVLIP